MNISPFLADLEKLDVRILKSYVPPHYKPSELTLAMCVGVQILDEDCIVRKFHKEQYGIKEESVKVAACNTEELPESDILRQGYDYKAFNQFQGDARLSDPYICALDGLGVLGERKFDFVYIRNPDLVDIIEWSYVFRRALEWTEPTGVVVTLVRRNDTGRYSQLLAVLEQHKVRPVLSCETRVEENSGGYCHTIGVFKPAA